jgi:hypothetical protein
MQHPEPLAHPPQPLTLAQQAQQIKSLCGSRLLSPQELLLLCADAIAKSYTPSEKSAP